MQNIDYVLDFATHLGKEMLACGANIERVNLTIELICKTYQLSEISINAMSTVITVCAKNPEGEDRISQVTVPPAHIHLTKLRKLNNLSYRVRREKPDLHDLKGLLEEALVVKTYPMPVVLGGYLLAMASLCRIFNGKWQDVLVVLLNTALLFFLSNLWSKANLNRMITNTANMFLCGASAFAFLYLGFAQNFYSIVITNAFFLIPGIPMVNGMRNILCGNEMNGILELLKVVLEVVTIVAGLWLAFVAFGSWYDQSFGEAITGSGDTLWELELVGLSFLASVGFGIVFQISPLDLLFAGMGGALIRIVYLALMATTNYRILYTAVAAFSAALYAEVLAFYKKAPATIFLYPSIIPLIPGDLFYYAMVGVVANDNKLFADNAFECLLALVGISVGFVLCSSFVHYTRKIKLRKLFPLPLPLPKFKKEKEAPAPEQEEAEEKSE